MSWEQLLSIYKEQRDDQQRGRMEPPVACPVDGQPLLPGPDGELHCNFDGYVWRTPYDSP